MTEVSRNDLDMPYFRVGEEAVYVWKLKEILHSIEEDTRTDLLHCDFCAYYFAYDRLLFVENHELW